jgi:hypothetical protein
MAGGLTDMTIRARESLFHLIEGEPSRAPDHREITDRSRGRAAAMTVEALCYVLRERGVEALKERDTRRRLAEVSDNQLAEVGKRARAFKFGRGAWTESEVEVLVRVREGLHHGR